MLQNLVDKRVGSSNSSTRAFRVRNGLTNLTHWYAINGHRLPLIILRGIQINVDLN